MQEATSVSTAGQRVGCRTDAKRISMAFQWPRRCRDLPVGELALPGMPLPSLALIKLRCTHPALSTQV